MAQHVGWRSFFWLNVGMLGFVLVLLIFLFPETKWHRTHPQEINELQAPETNSSEPEKPINVVQDENIAEPADAQSDPYLGKGRPSKKQFLL